MLEVLIAVAIAGLAFGSFLLLSSKTVAVTSRIFNQFVETIAAHNCLDEVIYNNKDCNEKEVNILSRNIKVKQDFETLMGFRIVKLTAGDITLYEMR